MTSIRYLSVCSGIEAATVAWHPLGWNPVGFAELAKFPSALLEHYYPTVPNFGDLTQHETWNLEAVDLLVGGTPCQSFSVAGLRGGMDDKRGQLALEFFRLACRVRPRWIVWENVPGVLSSNRGRDFGSILGALAELGYGYAYRVLDAQFFGVAQRRRRVFVVGYLGDWRCAAAVLFERGSLCRDCAPRRTPRQDLAANAQAGADSGCLGFSNTAGNTRLAIGDNVAAPRTQRNGDPGLVCFDPTQRTSSANRSSVKPGAPTPTLSNSRRVPMLVGTLNARTGCSISSQDAANSHLIPETTHALTGEGFDASEDGTGRGTPLVGMNYRVRRLTPLECERLQGFPDNYTLIPFNRKPAKDGPRYKAIGNSMAVPVMRWIGERVQMVENVKGKTP